MGRKDIPSDMTATQLNVLLGVRDQLVYRKERGDGAGKDFLDNGKSIHKGVSRQVEWLLDGGYIRAGSSSNTGRAYYRVTATGEKICHGL